MTLSFDSIFFGIGGDGIAAVGGRGTFLRAAGVEFGTVEVGAEAIEAGLAGMDLEGVGECDLKVEEAALPACFESRIF